MPRPQTKDAQFARVLDKLVANAPWLTPEEREVVADRRKALVKAVEAEERVRTSEKMKRDQFITGGKRRG